MSSLSMTPRDDLPPLPDRLLGEAQTRTRKAIASWHDNDLGLVVLLAPAAVELLCKAVLWTVNPALLTPASPPELMEKALARFARGGDPEASDARTVTLAGALSRLRTLHPDFPLERGRVSRLVDARNGSAHIGAAADVRHVLLDCITVTDFLLDQLSKDRSAFYGGDQATVDALAIEHQGSIEAAVRMRMAAARNLMMRREEQDGEDYDARTGEREAMRWKLDPEKYVPGGTSTDADCPECGRTGRLFGYADAEAEVDWDVEALGGGQYEAIPLGYWQPLFDPVSFRCNVCDLQLSGPEELRLTGLPSSRFMLAADALDDPGFDFDALTEAKSDYGD